ncbi:F0F1 ATP synthase subunit gamma [Candidatus Saccharibacteria bacterium]|nr:F0F1 ATP synthase subunit gamma [Candidatus Saccharibacteria bacterium]
MSTINDYQRSFEQYKVIEELTEALEGISSYRIRQIKDRVLLSKRFFQELFTIYQSLRVDKPATAPRGQHKRDLYIILTSASGLTGDIDNAIVKQFLSDYDPSRGDVMSIGARGAALLAAHSIAPVRYFDQPDILRPIDTASIIQYVPEYRRTYVYYQEFESLMVQRVGKIELILEAKSTGDATLSAEDKRNLIIASDYLFEPSEVAVVNHLEKVMLNITLTQLIFESQLSQFAARFTSMLTANSRAKQAAHNTRLKYLAARRLRRDEAAHEIIYAMRSVQ